MPGPLSVTAAPADLSHQTLLRPRRSPPSHPYAIPPHVIHRDLEKSRCHSKCDRIRRLPEPDVRRRSDAQWLSITLSAQLCRIRAEIDDRDRPPSMSSQLSSRHDAARRVVYKTATLPIELHRRETPSMLADPPNRLMTPDTCPSSQEIWATAQFRTVSVRVLKTVALVPGRGGEIRRAALSAPGVRPFGRRRG